MGALPCHIEVPACSSLVHHARGEREREVLAVLAHTDQTMDL